MEEEADEKISAGHGPALILEQIKEEKYKGMKKLITIAIALAMLATMILPVTALAIDSKDTTITANFESITLTAPTGKTSMVLAATGSQSLVSSTGSIVSNVNYNITAVDAMDHSKDTGDAGKMTKYDTVGNTYTNAACIANAVQVGSTMTGKGQTAGDLSATARDVVLGGTPTDTDTLITVTVTPQSETVLTGNYMYRIVITFVASAAS